MAIFCAAYKTNDKTVGAYLGYLRKAFLLYPVSRYDIKGKRHLETERKYYLCDLAFRFAELGTRHADYGHLYENIVAIELMRRGYEVYAGQMRDGGKTYIQVSDDISRPETFKREVSPLLSIKDAYPKMVIARTRHPESQHEGVRIVDIAEWLTDSQI